MVLKKPEIKVIYKNKAIVFDQPPVIVQGTTLVPMKQIFETFGMTVDYKALTKTIIAKDAKNEIILVIGSDQALVNGKAVKLSIPATLISNRTMVPLKFIGESVGLKVDYDANLRIITLY